MQVEAPEVVEFDVRTDEMLVNMGPQHPSTHGVLRLVLRTDGEVVKEVMPHVGYLHRCDEKIAENLTPIQFVPYTDRMDYLSAMNQNLAFCLAVEKLAEIEVPERAQVGRVIVSELNRIASHLVAIGTYGLDLGTFSPFLYAFRERERILDLFEMCCGARLTYSYIQVAGLEYDIPDGFTDRCADFLDYFEPKIEEYNNLLTSNHIFIKRTSNIGVISAERAIANGMTGPSLRGSAVAYDVRRSAPYSGYETYEFDVPVGTGEVGVIGDCWNRFLVRMLEMKECVKIIRQALDRLPEGEFRGKVPRKLPDNEVYVESETPRGAMGFYVVGNGKPKPYRVKVRSPSFCNLSGIDEMCEECLIGDIPAVVGSLDIVMGEVDR